jgi:RNA polymerase subunit RPABC4/transcription elongation factor Spt4
MSTWPPDQPVHDFPSLSVRWEGLVVVLDSTTLNTIVRKALAKVPEVRNLLIEPEYGRLGVTVTVRKKRVPIPLRSHFTSIRLKDGFLPIPNWLLRRIALRLPYHSVFFYPDERVIVIDLNAFLPEDLTVNVREVLCENGEMRFVFGPSQYRLDKLIEGIGKDPFAEE